MNRSFSKYSLLALCASAWLVFSPPAAAFSLGEFWDKITGKEFSPERMAKDLTKGTQDERIKAQRLFDWITQNIAYDVEAFRTKSQSVTDLEQLMRTKKGVCDDYAQLFNVMASSVGLRSTVVSGVVHDSSSSSGVLGHAWNLVTIDGRSYVVDTTWGAGQYDRASQKYSQVRDTRYFLVDPAQILLSHREEDEKGRPRELPNFTFEQFKQVQANTRKLAKLGVPSDQLISRLGVPSEQNLPVAEEAADAQLQIRQAPLEKPRVGKKVRFEISHAEDTTLALRAGNTEVPFQLSKEKTFSSLDYLASDTQPIVVIYKPKDGKHYKLLSY